MNFSQKNLAIVILLFGITLQALIFNRYDLYTTKLQVAWILLIGLFIYLPARTFLLLGAVVGWLISVTSSGSALAGACIGIAIGFAVQRFVDNPLWTLLWVRVLFVAVFMTALCLYWMFSYLSVATVVYSLVFIGVNTLASIMILTLLERPSYEK